MKQTLHKLLCLLLVLSMLLGAAPAVFAVGEGEDQPTHSLTYTSKGNGKHDVTCSVADCTEGHNATNVSCTYGAYSHVEGDETHQRTCAACQYVETTDCNKVYETSNGYHTQKCSVCGYVYVTATACVDSDRDGKCDVCGSEMPAQKTEIVVVDMRNISTNLEVPLNTTQAGLNLPTTVKGYAKEDSTGVNCSVSWSSSPAYDGTKPGTYVFTGTISAPADYTFASDVATTIRVTVKVVGDYTLTLSTASNSVTVGNTLNLTASITKRDSSTAVPNLKVEWFVDDSTRKIATISGNSIYLNRSTGTLNAISAGTSTSGKTVTVTATLKSGDTVLDTDSITVRIVPATATTIRQSVTGNGVTFGESAFYSALGTSLGKQLSYVTFDTPSSSKGTLYSDNSSRATKLMSSSKCYYNRYYNSNTIDLDDVYFKVADNYTGSSVTLGYTAYNADGNVIATGSIELSLSTAKISYTVSGDGKLTFDEDDFRKVLRASYYNSTLSYVQFDMSEAVFGNAYGGSSKYGYLYVDSGLKTKLTTSNDSYKFAYQYSSSSSRYYYDLDDVTYVAGSASGKYTVSIPFTAYGTGYESVSGTVEIQVNEVDAFTIDCIGTDFSAVAKVIADEFKNATYLMFELPEYGTLYYDFDAINNYGHKVRSTYAYYLDPSSKDEYDLDDVFYVPAAGATKATIRFDVYSGKTKLDSASVTFSVKSRTSSRVFTDVTYANTGSWSADSVDFMYANGLIYGTGRNKFNPNGTMTRGDLVLILYRLAGEPSVSNVRNPFSDVNSSDYYYKAVLWAYANSVVNGTGGSTFSPKKAVTREQLAAILYRYSGSPSSSTRLSGFTDASSVSSYATNAMKWAVGQGIITGSGTKLDPLSSATRAQVAAMLHRYLTK